MISPSIFETTTGKDVDVLAILSLARGYNLMPTKIWVGNEEGETLLQVVWPEGASYAGILLFETIVQDCYELRIVD